MSIQTNNTWILNLKNSDKRTYALIIETYSPALMGYIFSLTNDKAFSKDIIQNVFLKLWEKREKLSINSSIKSYLFKSAYNEFINLYHKENSLSALEKNYHESLSHIAQNTDDDNFEQLISEVFHEIDKLPPKCKEVFLLSRREGLTNKEIAKYLGISVKTVEAQITKSFKILRKRLSLKLILTLFMRFK